MQDLKSDARVSAAGDLAVTDEPFAKAAVRFADALARGDEAKLTEMLNKRAQSVLQELKSAGVWTTATKGIEAVRIVYADKPLNMSDLERDAAIKTMLAANKAAAERVYEIWLARGANRADSRAMADDELRKMNEVTNNLKFESSSLGADAPEMVMLLAVQDASGSVLLGWTASRSGDKWIFNNSSTSQLVRGKAKDWDGVGMVGFSLGTGRAVAEATVDKVDMPKGPQGGPQGPKKGPQGPQQPSTVPKPAG